MQRAQIIGLAVVVALVGGLVWWVRQSNHPSVIPVGGSTGVATTPSSPGRPSVAGKGVGSQRLRLPDRVQLIVTPEAKTGIGARISAVHALGTELTSPESEALAEYLRTPSRAEAPGSALENFLRNEILDKLVAQRTVPVGLPGLLAGIYQDHHQDVVMRDYAVQHIPAICGKLSTLERAALHKTLWDATDETDGTIAGTSLLALLAVTDAANDGSPRLSSTALVSSNSPPSDSARFTTEIDRGRLAETALRLASDKHCGELSRLTALSVCGRLKVAAALPVVTDVARRGPDVPLRLAAIAALGDLGELTTVGLLEELSQGPETRLRMAATAALGRLKKRLEI